MRRDPHAGIRMQTPISACRYSSIRIVFRGAKGFGRFSVTVVLAPHVAICKRNAAPKPNAGPGGETVRARVRTRGQQLDSRPRDAIETAIDSIPTCHLTSAVVAQWTEPPPLVRVTQDRIRATADQRVPRNRRGRPEDARESDRRVLWGTVGLNGLRGAVTGAAVRVSRGGESR